MRKIGIISLGDASRLLRIEKKGLWGVFHRLEKKGCFDAVVKKLEEEFKSGKAGRK